MKGVAVREKPYSCKTWNKCFTENEDAVNGLEYHMNKSKDNLLNKYTYLKITLFTSKCVIHKHSCANVFLTRIR